MMSVTAIRPGRKGRQSYMRLRDRHMLRAAIAGQHYTIRDTAALSRCSPAFMGHLLSGYKTSCSPELAVRIEKALRVAPGSLFMPRSSTVKLTA
jgi:hypothetical protein